MKKIPKIIRFFREVTEKPKSSKWGRVFDLTSHSIIMLSLLSLSLESLPALSAYKTTLIKLDIIFMLLFTIEYSIRVIGAPHRLRFVFSPLGIMDLIAILPFYISIGMVDLRSIRIFRLIRLLNSLNIIHYNQTMRNLRDAIYDVREELLTFFITTFFVLFLASVGIYHFENQAQPEIFQSIPHCFWWAIVTLTTVGYGDMYPVTAEGKIFTICILFVGLGMISVPSALLASSLVKQAQKKKEKRKKIKKFSKKDR